MRVGVFLGDAKAESGGGYTFQRSVLQALVELSSESGHSFVVFGSMPGLELHDSQIQFVSLERKFLERAFFRLGKKAAGLANRIRFWRGVFLVEGYYEEVILKSSIEMLWSLGPFCPSMELPYVINLWDLQHQLQPYFPEVSAKGEWDNRERYYTNALRRATAITTGTEVGKAEIERFYQVPSERIRVLPLPTPQFALASPGTGKADLLGKYQISEDYLFYPAQFWPHKNHSCLLDAVRILREESGISLSVVLVGSDKGNRQYIQKLAVELELSGQVHFLGFVSIQDLVSLYQNAFALVFPTFFGPDNLPPLEAFSLGCPVIASDVSGAREQLGESALLFDPKCPKQLAFTIKRLYDEPAFREVLRERGYERAAKWTAPDFVRGIFSIIDDFARIRRCWGT